MTQSDTLRSAYLFNLSLTLLQSQGSSSATNNFGRWQTYNAAAFGPTFGGGHDIYVDISLNAGYFDPFSYITTGLTNIPGGYGKQNVSYGALEVFSLSDPNATSGNSNNGFTLFNQGSAHGGPIEVPATAGVPEAGITVPAACAIFVALGVLRLRKRRSEKSVYITQF